MFFPARMGRGTVDDEQEDPNSGGHGLEADSEVLQNQFILMSSC
jgi:hypothetical protein